ncbi:MAG: glutamate--tRNA ligase family protein [Nanoarchaeota archaeon]|nr:glutamate--tRNA ligase family protein [Nanoarchaeota archaeon]
MIKNLDKKIKAYALKNAIAYQGKANPGAIISALFNEGLKKSEVKKTMPKIQKIINKIEKLSLKKQKKEFEKLKEFTSEREIREGLPELPNSEKGIIMRFAPSPSGAFHIGHALTACISYNYVKKYKGKFIVRIEDTNPENIYLKAYDLIKKDSKWLFEDKAEIIIQSERMDLYYAYAVSLIEKKSAYICTCSGDKFREFSKQKKECPCRNKTEKQNLEDWKKMLSKKGFQQGEAILRFKSDMTHKNPAMRDFPLARINLTKHPLQKNKYKVWPLMNLSVTTDDIEMGMTHIIRAKEHRDNAERQKMIFKVFNKEYPWVSFLGRIHLKGIKLSATQITKDIEEGKYSGWDDSKLPTIQSLKKRGYKPKAFYKLAEHIGLSEVDKTLKSKDFFELLDKFNKEEIS